MNTQVALNVVITVLSSLQAYFAGKDGDSFGTDDRIARILGYAQNELAIYLQELQSTPATVKK